MEKLKLVFMGTPAFAVESLRLLLEHGYLVAAVVTAPDKPAGRGQRTSQSAVKQFATENGLRVLQPANLKDEKFLNELQQLNPDMQVVVAFRMLPEIIWSLPRLGTYNLHASLLPKYRGAAPINWAIINGEKETGITTFKLKHEIDTGNILLAERVEIGEKETAGELHDRLMHKGAALMLQTVIRIEEGEKNKKPLDFKEQNNESVSHAPKINKETCRINWSKKGYEIVNLIRGLSPYPTAYTEIHQNEKKQILKIYKADFTERPHNITHGTIVRENTNSLLVACANGLIELKELQVEGKRKMSSEEFCRGYQMSENARMY